MKKRDRYYTYIFVNQKKVEPIYQAVQAAHVAMVIGQKMDKKFDSKNIYFQICSMGGYNLSFLISILTIKGFRVEVFYEPDVDDVIAIGVHPVRSDKRGMLKDFELLKF